MILRLGWERIPGTREGLQYDGSESRSVVQKVTRPNSSTIFSHDLGLLELRLNLEVQAAAELRPHFPTNEACHLCVPI
jgi:hypothetical protein